MSKRSASLAASPPTPNPWLWAALLPLFAWVAWLYWPVTSGDFVADDYVFLATARMVDAPWAAFWQSHFYEPYYFRPIGVIAWWVCGALFGLDYAAHSLVNLGLHLLNAALLFALLRALALRPSAVIAGVSLFALGPVTLAATLWPSNRFDLLACGFLLAQAIAMIRALHGSASALGFAMLAALAACWSKELAYPVATTLACLALAASGASWNRRICLFAALGLAIGSAFLMRHLVVADAYALAGAGPVALVTEGSATLISLLPRLTALAAGDVGALIIALGLFGAFLLALASARGNTHSARLGGKTWAALLVLLAAFIVQTPLAQNFALMLDGSAFGTVTFARFYYAPWLAASVVVALVLGQARRGNWVAFLAMGATIASAAMQPSLPESFARWTRETIKPMAVAATEIVDVTVSREGAVDGCAFVLLGTQAQHPFFRMFSDVTVKARSAQLQKTRNCLVMTESTPWLFALPADAPTVAPTAFSLRQIPGSNGATKPDSVWSSIRYRYRLPPNEVASLSAARFFDWREGKFVEVTDQVRRGERKLTLHDW